MSDNFDYLRDLLSDSFDYLRDLFVAHGWPYYSQNIVYKLNLTFLCKIIRMNKARKAADAGGLLCLGDVCIQNNQAM